MEKAILFLFILISSKNLFAQEMVIDSINGYYFCEGIIEVPNVSKDELYNRSKQWMLTTLKSSDNQTSYDDVEKNKMVGTGNIILRDNNSAYSKLKEAHFDFKITLLIKDGKTKYRIENIHYYAVKYEGQGFTYVPVGSFNSNLIDFKISNVKKTNEKVLSEIKLDLKEKIQMLINSYNTNLKTKASTDW